MSAKGLSSRAIIGRYYERLAAAPGMGWIDSISNYFNSDQESETYKWLGQVPQMREWIGGRQPKGFLENGITIANKHFEATLDVMVREMRRDKTGQVMVRVDELADRTNSHWAKLLSTLIENAESTVCYDGQYFFDTDHSEGDSGAQSNDISVDISALPTSVHGSGATAPSVEEMQLAILEGAKQLYSLKDNQGEPLNENARSFLVMVPVSLMVPAEAAVSMPLVANGSNITQAMRNINLSVAVNPRLTWTDKFSLWRTDGAVKPLIRQEEQPVQIKAIAEGSELEFREDKHQYGVDTWRNVGYGMWQGACLVTMT